VFVSLVAAVTVALWTATSTGRIYRHPFVLPLLAVLALVPAVWREPSSELPAVWHPDRQAFFTTALYKTCIPRNETVTIFPFGHDGDSLLYQAETNFWFRMASDNLGPNATADRPAWSRFDGDWVVSQLNNSNRPTMASLLAFAATHHVDRFITLRDAGYPDAAELKTIGPTQSLGGVLVTPACGQPPLTTRDLKTYVQAYVQARRAQANIGYCLGTNLEELQQGLIPSGPLQVATTARFVAGQGITCAQPPAGYTHHGYATADMGVPPDTYPLYEPCRLRGCSGMFLCGGAGEVKLAVVSRLSSGLGFCAIWAARTYVGARWDGAGCLVVALAAAQSPTGP